MQFSIEQILNMLETNDFEIWYATKFEDYIRGEEEALPKEEIVKELENLLL